MARVINVIRHPHLATFRDNPKYRSCVACDYQVIIENDEGKLIVSSVLDECCLPEFDIDDALRNEHNGEGFNQFMERVGYDEIDEFAKAEIENNGESITSALCDVLRSLRESHCRISNDGMNALNMLKKELDKLLKLEIL